MHHNKFGLSHHANPGASTPSHHGLDEVSFVLQRFRPKPEFFTREEDLLGKRMATKPDFSSISYRNGSIFVAYLHEQQVLLNFRVLCNLPITVRYVEDDCHVLLTESFRQRLVHICMDLSSSSAKSSASLFSVMSRLLLQLQSLPSTRSETSSATTDAFKASLSPQIVDFSILCLQCVATSRKSTSFCSPVPASFRNNGNGDVLMHRLRSFLSSRNAHSSASFMAFLNSLHWTSGATLQQTKTPSHSSNNTVSLCLNLDFGDPSPHFTQRAKQYGTMTAYHGTHVEKVWSILNYGLLNLSRTRLQQNGAMMGAGVYLSTSLEVASFFAKEHACVQWHGCPQVLQRLLKHHKVLLPTYHGATTVSCFAVFQATILAPPPTSVANTTRRDGKYYVVPVSDDILPTKLYLTFSLVQKPRFQGWSLWLLVVVVAGVVAISMGLVSCVGESCFAFL